MNSSAIVKWALIAGAAYLVYRYLDEQGYFGTLPVASAQPSAGVAPAATVPSSNLLLASSGAQTSAPGAVATAVQSPATPSPVYDAVPVYDSPVTVVPSAIPGQAPTVTLPAACSQMGQFPTPQQGAACAEAMGTARHQLAGMGDLEDLNMDELLAQLQPYHNRWGNA